MPAPQKSPRPRPNPRRSDPVSRGNRAAELEASEYNDALLNGGRGQKARGKVREMVGGGVCRGMGAATRGGKYRMS